ncbi:TlyA family RNA methyltransferase [Corynebacterium sp. MSK297]|uniref:TlyA family RNA methyltransferase n=1 Tax=Corynebacterium sp. MSK297 TaxID=3050221 RepID=UPI00254DE562|nr:TlyA family RNA methyltransferase [Corynebacterium sp. MSK297]MDK8846478.1 TlyA family RNA methyltransferase [Corynebacterium sp. MSK297]
MRHVHHPPRKRLDAFLVGKMLARSREHAVTLIKDGVVTVDGSVARKPSLPVTDDARVLVNAGTEPQWASRGAYKLLGALEQFEPEGMNLAGKRVLDAGASTGGFTDVCLHRGASEVVAADVGRGQLIPRLRHHPRVLVREQTNLRHVTTEDTDGLCTAMVGDLSFISWRLVLPAINGVLDDGADLLPMVKPQFEVGKERLGNRGVVRSAALREEVTQAVAEFAGELGLSTLGAGASRLPGPSGNVEYFLWLKKDGGARMPSSHTLHELIHQAVEEGPQ